MYFCVLYCCNMVVWNVTNLLLCYFLFFKQKTAYELQISDWSSDVCSSDLEEIAEAVKQPVVRRLFALMEFRSSYPAFNGVFHLQYSNDSNVAMRSDEHRVGTECVRTCSSRW